MATSCGSDSTIDNKAEACTALQPSDCVLLNACFFCCSPQVTFCGYSIPHPTEDSVNIRVQTTGEPCNNPPAPCSLTRIQNASDSPVNPAVFRVKGQRIGSHTESKPERPQPPAAPCNCAMVRWHSLQQMPSNTHLSIRAFSMWLATCGWRHGNRSAPSL